MTDDAYIPPSERRITSQESLTVPCCCGGCISCEFGNGTKTIHRRLRIDDHGVLASHAVVDSILAEAIANLRFARAQDFRGRENHDRAGCGFFGGEEQCRICRRDALIARYDALHKEAGQ